MIEVLELTRRYGSALAVDHLSFTVPPGRVTGFLGPNGAGKSTTLRMILGLDTPTSGRALVQGRRYRSLARPLRVVGALLDAGAVHGGRSARDHLAALAATNDLPRGRVAEALARTGLSDVAGRRVRGFSLGMRQRLGIAAALLGDPGVLLLDEPVNGLDPEGIRWIRTLLRSLAAEGRTVLVSSHLMSEMALTADHLIVIGRGRLIIDTGMREFIEASSADEVYVRTPDSELLSALLRAEGAQVALRPDEVPPPARADEDFAALRADRASARQSAPGVAATDRVAVGGGPGGLVVTGLAPEAVSRIAAAHAIAVHELTRRQASLEEAYLRLTESATDYRTPEAHTTHPRTPEGDGRWTPEGNDRS